MDDIRISLQELGIVIIYFFSSLLELVIIGIGGNWTSCRYNKLCMHKVLREISKERVHGCGGSSLHLSF